MLNPKSTAGNLVIALVPIAFLIIALAYNVGVVFGDASLDGSNQFILMLAAALTIGLGMARGVKFKKFNKAIAVNIGDTTKPILIILLIGALAGTWMISGVVPAMIYYGMQVLNPNYFLAASLLICCLVSLATGSSWGTTATVGIALMGMGRSMGLDEALVAGAIISGAYFGDKMSPLSDTTNLAPAMAGGDLFTHIRYMALTTAPSIIITFIIFIVIGLNLDSVAADVNSDALLANITGIFNITPWLFLVPALVIFLIAKKVDALIAIFFGVLAGALFAVVFQPQIIAEITQNGGNLFQQNFEALMRAIYGSVSIKTDDPILAELFSTKGMAGMLSTIWLILSALTFGGALEAAGFLKIIMTGITKLATNTASLIGSTLGTCFFLNVTASDQYLAIVIPGRMFKELYKERGLAPENLSRSLEDSGTVTSVLVPWNTCGAYQSGVLGVATGDFFMYCFFNIISPFMSLAFAIFNIKIKRIPIPEPKIAPTAAV